MDDRRKLKRQHIMFYSRVFDRTDGAFIGYLGNLTPDGAMVIGESELETQKEFQLRIDLPEDIYDKAVLNLKARSAWCKQDIDPNFFTIGFSLHDVSPEDIGIITEIISDYGLGDFDLERDS